MELYHLWWIIPLGIFGLMFVAGLLCAAKHCKAGGECGCGCCGNDNTTNTNPSDKT